MVGIVGRSREGCGDLERALRALPGVVDARAALIGDGPPGVRATRVVLEVDERSADAPGPLVRAAVVALGAAGALPASLALERLVDGVRLPVDPVRLRAAAVAGATVAGGELLVPAAAGRAGQ